MAITRIRIEGEDVDLQRLRDHVKWVAGELAASFDPQGVSVLYGHELFERKEDGRYVGRLTLNPDISAQDGFADRPTYPDDYLVRPNGLVVNTTFSVNLRT